MSNRKWTAQEKFRIVMEGFKGYSMGERCNEYGLTQSQYYRWRVTLLFCPKFKA